MIPSPWEWALLTLAAFRVWRLIAHDDITEPLRAKLIDHRWEPETQSASRRDWVALFMDCPWCCGAWLSFAWVGAFWLWPHGTIVAAVPFAVSAAVGLIASGLSAVPD